MNFTPKFHLSQRIVGLSLIAFCLFTCHFSTTINGPGYDKTELSSYHENYSNKSSKHGIAFIDSIYYSRIHKTALLKSIRFFIHAINLGKTGPYDQAILYADSGLKVDLAQNLKDTLWADHCTWFYMIKGDSYFYLGNYKLSMDNYFNARQLADKMGYATLLTNVDHNVGLILYKQHRYQESKRYFEQAFRLQLKQNLRYANHGKQELLDNIALCFAQVNNNDSAQVYYHRALNLIGNYPAEFNPDTILNRMTRETDKAVIYGNIAELLLKQHQLNSAEIWFKRAIKINVGVGLEKREAQNEKINLAGLYDLQKQYAKMGKVLNDLHKSLDTLPNQQAELDWKRLMARLALNTGKPLDELKYYKSYVFMRDSIAKTNAATNESDITQGLKDKGQVLQISLLQKDNQLSHLYLYVTIGLTLLALTIIVLVYYYYRQSKRNVGQLTRLNGEVREQKERLEFAIVELEKSNTDKERILKVVAHDLRNPISGIVSLANAVMNDDIPPDEEKQIIGLIEKASANSLSLINELLEFDLGTQQTNLTVEKTDINSAVRQCVDLMRLTGHKKGQEIRLMMPPELLLVNINPEKIERMLNNLIGNAIKFSPIGEKIIVELQAQTNHALIAVKDKGIGISTEMQADIFTTFHTTRRKGTAGEKSFGLGLSISKQIAEAHGGKIWLDSEPGKGTVFYVELPLQNDI